MGIRPTSVAASGRGGHRSSGCSSSRSSRGSSSWGPWHSSTQPHVPTAHDVAWGVFAGVFGVVGLAAFYRALAVGTMGIVGPISATGVIVPVVYGLSRGERPGVPQAVGIIVAVVGVVAASLEPLPEGRRPEARDRRGLRVDRRDRFRRVVARPQPGLAGRRRVGDADAASDRRADRPRRAVDHCGRPRRSSAPFSRSSSRSDSSTPAQTFSTERPRATDSSVSPRSSPRSIRSCSSRSRTSCCTNGSRARNSPASPSRSPASRSYRQAVSSARRVREGAARRVARCRPESDAPARAAGSSDR